MIRRLAIVVLAGVLSHGQPRKASSEEVDRLHRSMLLIDLHNDVPIKTLKGYDIAAPAPRGSTDIPRLRAGNVGAQFFAAYVPARYAATGKAADQCRRVIANIKNQIIARRPETFVFARTADEILAARKQGKIAALIGIEGGHAIEDSLAILREFFHSGARYMTLTHSNTNNWAESSGDASKGPVKRPPGLTSFGREVIAEMNRLGMMVDISHVSDATFWDVLKTTRAPLIASHSSCRAIADAPRNMTDDMLRALARNRGVIHINFACGFLSQAVRKESARKQPLQRKYGDDLDGLREVVEKRFTRATLADVVAHIDHVVRIAGIDSVGLGSDFDGIDCTPVGLSDVSQFPNLTRALLEKGYTPGQISKIYGENTLRVMREVERAAGPAK